jgi:hypothetical protein
MNAKHVIIALVVIAGIVAVGMVAMNMTFAGLHTSGTVKVTDAVSGTVTFIDLEGGFYGIVADDGARYLPLNLPEEFAEDGLAITAEVVVKEDVATIQQWGTPVEIVSITANGKAAGVVEGA